jgi:hypothetical protein
MIKRTGTAGRTSDEETNKMKRWNLAGILLVVAIVFCTVPTAIATKKGLDEKYLTEAMALASRFKKHNDFLEDGLKPY